MKRILGFVVERRPSTIADAGRGVFVAEGKVSRGAVASLYPGTLYEPDEPVLFPSIGNAFVLRCVDGLLVDGKDRGISRRIYLSCAARDRLGSHAACDTTWLTPHPRVPLAIGQYVNNQPKDRLANVVYQEVDLSADFPSHLMKYVPNVFNSPDTASKRPVRLVALLALRDINTEEELFSTYFTEVH
ncbi:SET domain-containing protein 9-like [Oscarella lobularis]|uniref:SET domain-containing protein 9-like n=1 Tax=Oscarella lobularis TaxID=121494 RepID=UPI00331358EE